MKFCGKPCRYIDGQTLKGYTARQANQLLQRAGQLFWQTESYDHSVRDLLEGQRIRAYIENNPVKAGLAAHAEEYPWSSANPWWKAETTLRPPDLVEFRMTQECTPAADRCPGRRFPWR
jgi:hypothetical protein